MRFVQSRSFASLSVLCCVHGASRGSLAESTSASALTSIVDSNDVAEANLTLLLQHVMAQQALRQMLCLNSSLKHRKSLLPA